MPGIETLSLSFYDRHGHINANYWPIRQAKITYIEIFWNFPLKQYSVRYLGNRCGQHSNETFVFLFWKIISGFHPVMNYVHAVFDIFSISKTKPRKNKQFRFPFDSYHFISIHTLPIQLLPSTILAIISQQK